MSEHTRIISKEICYDHIPYREEGFTWCKKCKRFVEKIEIGFHEGWYHDWMKVVCGHCHKTIWVCSFKPDPRKGYFGNKSKSKELKELKKLKKDDPKLIEALEGVKEFIKDDKKCDICKKPTNQYDCVAYGGNICKKRISYWCSSKCYSISNKLEVQQLKKLEKKKNASLKNKTKTQ